jgi:hypothetical protein
VGNGSGGNFFAAIQDRVLLFVWVVGWICLWFGGKFSMPTGTWVRHGKLSDVDVAAVLAAAGMLAFSFAPAYTYVSHPSNPEDCSFADQPEQVRCLLQNFQLVWQTPTGINAWHQTSTALPVALVIAVGVLVLIRGLFPIVPAVLVRLVTRVLLLLATIVLGWAIFNPSDAIFDETHYGWGLWAELGCLSLISVLAMSRPPRFLSWLIA